MYIYIYIYIYILYVYAYALGELDVPAEAVVFRSVLEHGVRPCNVARLPGRGEK
jgi:hypothetical protein